MKFNTVEEAIEYLHQEVRVQDELREGLETLIRKWEKDSPDAGYGYDSEAWIPELLEYLHSKRVVIRVNRECPDCAWSQFKEWEAVGMTPCWSCNSTGYFFEPLIKEKHD